VGGAAVFVYIGMSRALKRELKCPTGECSDTNYCLGCDSIRDLLNESFVKFVISFTLFAGNFFVRFIVYTIVRVVNFHWKPTLWEVAKPWHLYVLYATELFILCEVIVVRAR
jgi:hypothetical protein